MTNSEDTTHTSVLLPLVILLILVYGCFHLLIKGFYNLSSHLIPAIIMMTTWVIMFVEKGSLLTRMDNVVYIFMACSIMPLLIGKYKYSILAYSLINILLVFVFVFYVKDEYGLVTSEVRDYLIDVTVSFAFVGFVSYSIFSINKKALDSAETDLRKRIIIEKDFAQREKRYKELAELLPQTVYESSLNGTLTFMNRAGTIMFGYTDEDIRQGLNVLSTIAKDDRERVMANIKKIIDGETTPGNQYMGQRKDGTTFPMQIHSSPIIENDKTVGFRGVIFDLTEIKEVENDLRQSNELFRTLIESIPIPSTLSGMDKRFLVVNKAFCSDLGLNPEDVLGKTIDELEIKTEGGKEEIISNLLKEKGFVENFEISTCDKNGRRHELYVYATIVTNNNQKTVLRSNVNVTEKKKLESKLRESEALFRTIVDMVPYWITISNDEKKLTFANRAMLEKFHFDLNEMKGKTLHEMGFRLDENSQKQYANEYGEKGDILSLEVNVISPEQEKICTLLSSQNVMIDSKPHVITTTVDITDRKMLEEQLIDYNIKLEEIVRERTEDLEAANEELSATNEELLGKSEIILEKNNELNEAIELIKNAQLQLIQTEKMASLGILTAGVAHEVNNPLNYLMGAYVGLEEYFLEHGSNNTDRINTLLNSMQVGIERITNIVKGLNQFSRDNDSLEETCDIHAIIDNCTAMLHNKLKNKVVLTKKYFDDSIIVKGNVGRLHQVFVNILSNALQAIPAKGIIIIETKIKGENATIEITDNGIGIDKKSMPYLTDPFFTTKAPGEGTGLGLSITQTIVKEHHGEMKFESEINKGTKVILSFPLK